MKPGIIPNSSSSGVVVLTAPIPIPPLDYAALPSRNLVFPSIRIWKPASGPASKDGLGPRRLRMKFSPR
jgi:hypothetical protein